MTVLMYSAQGQGARIVRDVGGRAPAAMLAAIRSVHGAPDTWTVSQGVITRVIDSPEEVMVEALVTGPFTGECRLLAAASAVMGSALCALPASTDTQLVRFRVVGAVDAERVRFLTRSVP